MTTPDAQSQYPRPLAEPHTPDQGVVQRWRERSAERKLARLLRPRRRRDLVERLRRTAREATDRPRIRPGPDVLLHYRAAAVRTDLLEIAALLEQAHNPDPACVKEIHKLLANGDSPLYHPGVHISELYATLHYVRAGLVRDRASHLDDTPQITKDRGSHPAASTRFSTKRQGDQAPPGRE